MFMLWRVIEGQVLFKGKGCSMVSQAPTPSPRAPFVNLRNEDHRNMELPHIRYTELKFSDNESELHEDEDGPHTSHLAREDVKAATVPLLPEAEDMNEDRTPIFSKGNRFFGIPLTDSANASPRWTTRIPRKSLLEKTEFASEYTEGSAPSEADGDLILHHMKGQARLDRKSLMALYMELDEERSASAVAANNAMAMITKLQAEKAAVQMEALQYQRMMEEQAEYDQEALQATNDLLAKREEDITVLEAELDEYRERYGLLREEGFEGSGDEGYQDMNSQSFSSYTEKSEYISPAYCFTDGPMVILTALYQLSFDMSGQEGKLMKELLHLHERVKAREADDEFSKHAGYTIQNDSEREKLLTEICDNLQKLRQFITLPFDDDYDA
ncbi:hypothetical protein GH714_022136 [Hevea brasiliensis]|uniref:GTD-binding domain-containing protein n=1 Tax=Hevea brasiliensis TaxID=3981 RepID=A0A6A6MFU6_HEVBR|nr:hypothetical protein GH714_022136 [Hevea brasiliensis]